MGGVIAVGDLEGYVHFLTREEGKFAARVQLDSNAVMSLVAGTKSNQLIAETRDGGLYAISINENNVKPTPAVSKPDTEVATEPAPARLTLPEPEISPSEMQEPAVPESSNEPNSERSILFQNKDSILLPDSNNQDNSGPGIRLPSQEQQ